MLELSPAITRQYIDAVAVFDALAEATEEAALDTYSFTRDAYLQYRNTRIGNQAALAPLDDSSIDALVPPEPAK